MKRPKLSIPQAPIDRQLDLLAIVGMILLLLLPFYFYGDLPDRIPIHYDLNGVPDGYGHKTFIWLLPGLGGLLFWGLWQLKKYPHTFNYPQPITEQNAERLYRLSVRMLRSLNAIITGVFAYITYATIQTALGNQNGLGPSFMPIFLVLLFGTLGYFYGLSMKKD